MKGGFLSHVSSNLGHIDCYLIHEKDVKDELTCQSMLYYDYTNLFLMSLKGYIYYEFFKIFSIEKFYNLNMIVSKSNLIISNYEEYQKESLDLNPDIFNLNNRMLAIYVFILIFAITIIKIISIIKRGKK